MPRTPRTPTQSTSEGDPPKDDVPEGNRANDEEDISLLDLPNNDLERFAEVGHVDRIGRLDLPPFWSRRPELWFHSVEAQFQLKKITVDSTKYYAILTKLDQDTLSIIESVISNPPATGKYKKVKEILLHHFSVPQDRRFRMLTSGLELGDKRPSQLLAEMHRCGGTRLDGDYIRTLWLDRLPRHVQAVLTTASSLSDLANEELATLADKIVEIHRPTGDQLMPVSRSFASSQPSILERRVEDLSQQLEEILRRLQKMEKRGRSNSRGAKNRSSTPANLEVCFYHRKFGNNATRCTKPCSWTPPAQGNAPHCQ